MARCIVCDRLEPVWPKIDAPTGLSFCDSCYGEARHLFCVISQTFSTDSTTTWLKAIADARLLPDTIKRREQNEKTRASSRRQGLLE